MTTKIKKNRITRGRPRKDFSIIEIKDNYSNEPRSRGRPKKETRIEESVNTKIHNHTKEISKLSKENEKLNYEIKDTSFVIKKIKNTKDKKSDKFALGLLIFSMVLFIFSLYKTFYANDHSINKNLDLVKINNTINQKVDNDIILNTGSVLIKDVSSEVNQEDKKTVIQKEESKNDSQFINIFYENINNKNFTEISSLVDNYLKASNVFRTYYNSNWLSKFVGNLVNEKVYITNIKEINLENKKEGVSNYAYTIKYKLNNNNELFQEEWEAAIVTKGEQKLIGSLRCVTIGCSKMPFFNLPRYEK